LSPTRDAEAATRFFLKALHSTTDVAPQAHPAEEQMAQPATVANPATSAPRVINVDKNAAYPKAVANLKAAGALPEHVELRQVKYLNHLIEQDHRFIQPFPNAWRSRGWVSSRSRRPGEHSKDSR
jgi:transposase-like protein